MLYVDVPNTHVITPDRQHLQSISRLVVVCRNGPSHVATTEALRLLGLAVANADGKLAAMVGNTLYDRNVIQLVHQFLAPART